MIDFDKLLNVSILGKIKIMNYINNFFKVMFIAFLTTILSSNLVAQEINSSELNEFLVIIETTDSDEIKLKCKEGCAWETLTFNLSESKIIQAIDEFGMTDGNGENRENENSSDFLITVQKTDNDLIFKGLNGTAWTDLSFSIKPFMPQTIDEMGMTR